MFSVVNTVLLQPLAYPDAGRIVSVETLWTETGRVSQDVSGPDFLDWQAQNRVFEKIAVSHGGDDFATIVGDRAVFANARYVSADFFAVFGQAASAGRLLMEPMDELFDSALAYPQFRSRVIGLFGVVAALLSAVGVFSVLAYLVGQRRRESRASRRNARDAAMSFTARLTERFPSSSSPSPAAGAVVVTGVSGDAAGWEPHPPRRHTRTIVMNRVMADREPAS